MIMKELSIEEKAKAYDKVIEKLRDFYRDYDTVSHLIDVKEELTNLFPELCESEDERIRKELIEHVKDQQSSFISAPDCRDKYEEEENNKYNSWLSWLEKQKQEPIKVSIWKHWKDGIAGNGEGKPIYLIKDGDAYRISSVLGCECDYIELSDLDELILPEKQGEQKSIDKIQLGKKYKCIASPRYTTFMIGEIYKPEDKFLCSLMNFCYGCFEPIEDGEQKPSDEDMVEALRTEYEKGRADAFAQMREGWSKEDESIALGIEQIVNCASLLNIAPDKLDKVRNWLKLLKERYTWKPSDAQIRALEYIINNAHNTSYSCKIAKELLEQLKKLKGE